MRQLLVCAVCAGLLGLPVVLSAAPPIPDSSSSSTSGGGSAGSSTSGSASSGAASGGASAPVSSGSAKSSGSSGSTGGSTSGSSSAPPPPSGSNRAIKGDTFVRPKSIYKTASGLGYQIHERGKGAQAVKGKTVTVHYTGWLLNGTKFDSSYDAGKPFSFKLGEGLVIDGWEEGVALMREGDIFTFTVPAKLAYGPEGAPPDIPPNATLAFKITLLKVQ